jgi:hypothetical protein
MIKKAGVVLLTVLGCLGILEIGLRALGRRPTNITEGIAVPFEDSFRLKKNITKLMKVPAFSYTVHTNEYGFRDSEAGPRDLTGKPFSVFLGASDVYGNGVEYEDSFVGIFAKEAAKKGMNVLNMAVGGHFFLDQEHLLKDFMRSTGQKPSVVFHCVNALHIPWFDARNKDVVVKSGYVIDRSGWRIAYLRLMAGNTSAAYCFFRDGIRRIQERYLGYRVNEKASEFLQVYFKKNPIREAARTRKFEDYLTEFEAFCRQAGIELVYIYLPLSDSFRLKEIMAQMGKDPNDYDETFYEDLMRSHCEKRGIKLVNLTPVLRQHYGDGKELRFKLDPHFNTFGNAVIGEWLIKELL